MAVRLAANDYDGDGKSDLAMWRAAEAQWYVIGSSAGVELFQQWGITGDISVPGDYDGDGKTDFAVWRPSTGVWWTTNGASQHTQQWGQAGDIPVPGDYDGDGRADFAVWRPSTGEWWITYSSDGSQRTRQFGLPGELPLLVPLAVLHAGKKGDFDGDGRTDVGVWRPATGVWWVLPSSGSTEQVHGWGTAADIPVPGDYDGDGRADLAFWRPGTGEWNVIRSSDGSAMTQPWGSAGDIPVPGDYDGDGRADFAIWRPSSGEWLLIHSSDGSLHGQQLGATGDIQVPADYDGDGTTDFAVWRPSTGEWEVIYSSDGSQHTQQWGQAGDIPVPADYDGDGAAGVAIWRPTAGDWLISYSSDGSQQTQVLGLAGDVPLPQPAVLPTFVLQFGLVSDQELQDADVLVFVPTDLTGDLIDLASGLYGYSHCGIATGTQMFDVDNTNQPTVPQVEAVDLQAALARPHVACRFGLEADQAKAVCACVMAQTGEGMDWLELVTFGALNIPGRELCTMLIMHCLDNIGFNRGAIGLGGFVSPKQIARVFNAPRGTSAF